MTSIIRVGQSKFAAVPIDEDSQERVMNCITTLANLDTSGKAKAPEEETVDEIFLKDTKAAYAKMVATEEKKAAEKKEKENKTSAVQVDDLLTFRQFSKKNAADGIDVSLLSHKVTSLHVPNSLLSTNKMLPELPDPRKFRKIWCQTSAALCNLLVSLPTTST